MNRRRLREWLPEFLFLTITTGVGLWAGGRWLDPVGDPGFAWSLAYRLSEGDVLYRDVYLAYGPVTPYLLAGVTRIVGSSPSVVLLWNWIPAIVAGVLLLRLGRPYLTTLERVACALLVAGFSVIAPGPARLVLPYYPGVVHALVFSILSILIVAPDRSGESKRAWISGALAGLAFGMKQELGVAALAAIVASRLVRPREMAGLAARSIAGFVLGVAPAALIAVSNAPVRSLRDQSHLWPLDLTPPPELDRIYRMVAGLDPGWSTDLRAAMWSLLVNLLLLGAAALLIVRERRPRVWAPVLVLAPALAVWWLVEGFSQPFRAPAALSASLAFLLVPLALARREFPDRARLVAIATFAGLAGARTIFSPRISGPFDGPAHFVTSLTWVLFLSLAVPLFLTRSPTAAATLRRLSAVYLLLIGSFTAVAGAEALRFPWKRRVSTRMGDVFLSPKEAPFFERLRRELRAGETTLVVPEVNAIDALFAVRNVSPILDLLPGWLDAPIESELIRRLKEAPPSAVVVFNRPLSEFGFERFGSGYGEALEGWILDNYRPVFSDRAGTLYRRRS